MARSQGPFRADGYEDFYDPEDLRLYLDDLTPKSMDPPPQTLPTDVPQNSPDSMLQLTSSDVDPSRQRDPPKRQRSDEIPEAPRQQG
ncbi:hypothetical protein NDU88_001628 [Pleurodeles waltl]|uniref:Uncharacterized protein n=1 Tax=Pleurodeles waltl TaxID=8319 RepID=A0AAV7PD36_PLEWA|nr:hypothetical protein NDU88_001628 [Pleurodeles waltl]